MHAWQVAGAADGLASRTMAETNPFESFSSSPSIAITMFTGN
jgi:hypothetical protein